MKIDTAFPISDTMKESIANTFGDTAVRLILDKSNYDHLYSAVVHYMLYGKRAYVLFHPQKQLFDYANDDCATILYGLFRDERDNFIKDNPEPLGPCPRCKQYAGKVKHRCTMLYFVQCENCGYMPASIKQRFKDPAAAIANWNAPSNQCQECGTLYEGRCCPHCGAGS